MNTCNLKGSHGGLSGVLLSKIAKTNSQGEIPVHKRMPMVYHSYV